MFPLNCALSQHRNSWNTPIPPQRTCHKEVDLAGSSDRHFVSSDLRDTECYFPCLLTLRTILPDPFILIFFIFIFFLNTKVYNFRRNQTDDFCPAKVAFWHSHCWRRRISTSSQIICQLARIRESLSMILGITFDWRLQICSSLLWTNYKNRLKDEMVFEKCCLPTPRRLGENEYLTNVFFFFFLGSYIFRFWFP